jgi:hypothetical protein
MRTFDKLQFFPNKEIYKRQRRYENIDILQEYLKDKYTLYRDYRDSLFEMKKTYYSWYYVLKISSYIIAPISFIIFYYGFTYFGIGMFLFGILNIILSKISYKNVYKIELTENLFCVNDMEKFFELFDGVVEKSMRKKNKI